jgi:large subunit ribosomal protein L10
MALTKEKKEKSLKKIEESIDNQKIMLFVGIAKIKTKELFGLKNELKEKGNILAVVKKTLFKMASKNKGVTVDPETLKGEVAVIYGKEDEVSAAKIINKFLKENEDFKILGGVFENEPIGEEKVLALAKIPSKAELLAKTVGSIKAPVSGFVNVLNGNLRGLVLALSAISKNKS